MPGEAIWFLMIGGGLCTLGALGGIMSERRRLGFVIRDQAARNVEQGRRLTELDRVINDAQADNRALASFLVVLPDVVRRLNTNKSKRSIPPLLTGTVDQIFEPAQILIYTTRVRGELVLAASKGLPQGFERGHRIKIGEGPIGLVARHQMTMDREELMSESLSHRSAAEGPTVLISASEIASVVNWM